jgi:hypothetical protein
MEYGQNQNNPTGIWQHIWITLTMKYLENMAEKNYLGAWEALKDYKEELPPECATEAEELYKKIESIINEIYTLKGNSLQTVKEKQAYLIHQKLPQPLRELKGKITKSLFDNGWINKNFTIHPRNQNTAKIGVQE